VSWSVQPLNSSGGRLGSSSPEVAAPPHLSPAPPSLGPDLKFAYAPAAPLMNTTPETPHDRKSSARKNRRVASHLSIEGGKNGRGHGLPEPICQLKCEEAPADDATIALPMVHCNSDREEKLMESRGLPIPSAGLYVVPATDLERQASHPS